MRFSPAVGSIMVMIGLTSCGDGTSSLPAVATVGVAPGSLDLLIGQTGQLTATPRDAAANALSGRLVTWMSDAPAVATVDNAGLVSAVNVGTATVSATSEGKIGTASVRVRTLITGLDFPGNDAVPDGLTMRFQFNAPMAAYPATYIWRVYPRQQTGYYTAFFHANDSTGFNSDYQYYGFHPYPSPPTDGTPMWEISVDGGRDEVRDPVVFDQWYLQVAVVNKTSPAAGADHMYYWNWPNTTRDTVSWHAGQAWPPAPNPAIMVGDNPWNPGQEVWNGIMRGFQFYDVALTPSEIAQEIAAPGSSGHTPWYLNLNPTPADISDKSGRGHNPSWVGNLLPTLWKDTIP